jgi:serine/threonine-protein kinase RsbW
MKTPDKVRVNQTTGKTQIAAPGDGSYLAYLRSLVGDLARRIGFSESEIAKIEMAVDEACSNVLEHAYAPDKQWLWRHREPELRMEVRTEAGRLVIEINDHGQSFDFDRYRPTDIDRRLKQMSRGGYGIHIMRQFMDEVQYSSNNQTGNTLRLVKYLKKS